METPEEKSFVSAPSHWEVEACRWRALALLMTLAAATATWLFIKEALKHW